MCARYRPAAPSHQLVAQQCLHHSRAGTSHHSMLSAASSRPVDGPAQAIAGCQQPTKQSKVSPVGGRRNSPKPSPKPQMARPRSRMEELWAVIYLPKGIGGGGM